MSGYFCCHSLPHDLNQPTGHFTVIKVDLWPDKDDESPAAAALKGRLMRLPGSAGGDAVSVRSCCCGGVWSTARRTRSRSGSGKRWGEWDRVWEEQEERVWEEQEERVWEEQEERVWEEQEERVWEEQEEGAWEEEEWEHEPSFFR